MPNLQDELSGLQALCRQAGNVAGKLADKAAQAETAGEAAKATQTDNADPFGNPAQHDEIRKTCDALRAVLDQIAGIVPVPPVVRGGDQS